MEGTAHPSNLPTQQFASVVVVQVKRDAGSSMAVPVDVHQLNARLVRGREARSPHIVSGAVWVKHVLDLKLENVGLYPRWVFHDVVLARDGVVHSDKEFVARRRGWGCRDVFLVPQPNLHPELERVIGDAGPLLTICEQPLVMAAREPSHVSREIAPWVASRDEVSRCSVCARRATVLNCLGTPIVVRVHNLSLGRPELNLVPAHAKRCVEAG